MDAPCSGQSSDFPAAGAGLGVGPDLVAPGLGNFLAVRRAARHRRSVPVASLATAKIGAFAVGTMSDHLKESVCEIHKDDNDDVFILIDGMKIAKRGLPDTAHAMTWIMLEPGWIQTCGRRWAWLSPFANCLPQICHRR
jgi:hypothetical protein